MIVIKHTQPQQYSPKTADLLAAKGKYMGNGVTTWSNFDEKEPISDLPEACKEALKETFRRVKCNTYNPQTADLVYKMIEKGKELKDIVHALHNRKGCKEATVKRVHAAIQKGLKALDTPPPKPKAQKTIIWV